MMEVQGSAACWTHRGGRSSNQDAAIALTLADGRELVAVADGMGGHVGGAVASRLALETLAGRLGEGASLVDAVRAANEAVHAAPLRRPEWQGMGTTLVALLRTGGRYEIANVGDSRAYRVGAGGVEQITRDHSYLAEALAQGELAAEEARRSPWRHAVTRSLGLEEDVEVDTFGPFTIREPHYVLLCSDGLSNVLPEEALGEPFVGGPEPQNAAERLGLAALAVSCTDNVTAAVTRLVPERLSLRRRRRARPEQVTRPAVAHSVWRWRVLEAAIVAGSVLLLVSMLVMLARIV